MARLGTNANWSEGGPRRESLPAHLFNPSIQQADENTETTPTEPQGIPEALSRFVGRLSKVLSCWRCQGKLKCTKKEAFSIAVPRRQSRSEINSVPCGAVCVCGGRRGGPGTRKPPLSHRGPRFRIQCPLVRPLNQGRSEGTRTAEETRQNQRVQHAMGRRNGESTQTQSWSMLTLTRQ